MDVATLPYEVLEDIVEAWKNFDATGDLSNRLDVHFLSGPVGLIDGVCQSRLQFEPGVRREQLGGNANLRHDPESIHLDVDRPSIRAAGTIDSGGF